jgi:hypothetical protein
MIYFAIFTGCLMVIGLSIYIYGHLNNAKQEKAKQQLLIEQHLQEHNERQQYVTDSIDIIIKALHSEQVGIIEASIRLKVLVDQLKPMFAENSLPVIEQVFSKTQHIPKLKEWKALDKQQRKQFTQEMDTIEVQYSEQVKLDTKKLSELMANRKIVTSEQK